MVFDSAGTCRQCCTCNSPGIRSVSQCRTCISGRKAICMGLCDAPGCSTVANQKRIWHQSRAASSSYMDALAAITVYGGPANRPAPNGIGVNWNQMSDRAIPHIGMSYNPSRGNTLRSSVVRHRPGAGTYAGRGVDVKHHSYARYLSRRKASALITQSAACNGLFARVLPLKGNKRRKIGLVSSSSRCRVQCN